MFVAVANARFQSGEGVRNANDRAFLQIRVDPLRQCFYLLQIICLVPGEGLALFDDFRGTGLDVGRSEQLLLSLSTDARLGTQGGEILFYDPEDLIVEALTARIEGEFDLLGQFNPVTSIGFG